MNFFIFLFSDGYALPKGCGILISIIALHRDKKYWPNSLKFNPDRFLPEEVEKQIPYTYMPFSLGPRDCIGIWIYYILELVKKVEIGNGSVINLDSIDKQLFSINNVK